CSKQARYSRHLAVGIDAHTTHNVMGRGSNLHWRLGDADIRQLLELMIHTRELLLNMSRGIGKFLLDPGDVQEHSTMRTSPALLDFANNAARHVVACQELGRTANFLVSLSVAPTLLFTFGGLGAIELRYVFKHEAAIIIIE